MMNKHKNILFCALLLILSGSTIVSAQQQVQKTNPMKVYMHYMPWYETPETIGAWGWHWTMNNKNPNIIEAGGQRQIAAHFYPLIGPYASRDKDVIEYHLLLMKFSGVDGVLINWYGIEGSNGDITDLIKSSDSLVSYTDDFGIQFGVVMEDRFSRSISDVKANMTYLKDNYFNRPEYIRYGVSNEPLVCVFGPITFQSSADWTEIIPSAGEDIEFLTLWYESGDAGANADGEFSWVYQDNTNHITHLDNFYKLRTSSLKTVVGSVYPGFEDFYKEGGVSDGYFTIPANSGSTLDATFEKAEEYKSVIDMVQLVTFNDFGEGTMFEPTVETGFEYLKRLQQYTGVSYGETELSLVHRLYVLRKDYASDPEIQLQLNLASGHMRNLEINEASEILNSIATKTTIEEQISGDMNLDNPLIFPNPISDGKINISFNADLLHTANVIITEVCGKKIYETISDKGVANISIDNLNLSPGTYFLILQTGNLTETARFVVVE